MGFACRATEFRSSILSYPDLGACRRSLKRLARDRAVFLQRTETRGRALAGAKEKDRILSVRTFFSILLVATQSESRRGKNACARARVRCCVYMYASAERLRRLM